MSVQAQIYIQKEELSGTRYRLSCSTQGYRYSVNDVSGKKYLSFTGNVSEQEDAVYPTRDLFIALPPNTHPSLQFVVINQQPLAVDGITNVPAYREIH